MEISFDPAKRDKTLRERGLDFADAEKLFGGRSLTLVDDRFDYGEARFQTYGLMDGQLMMVAWTPRGNVRHIISMRRCNEREKAKIEPHLV
ncbi:MAG TPA: BrnT family toxin [Rhizomicrobium sp.]|nr:BrnT family toxin [Rhizomicrobium sp.]